MPFGRSDCAAGYGAAPSLSLSHQGLDLSDLDANAELIDAWLLPLSEEAPCGPDLEYDNDFLEINKAAEGKPGTQFGPGEPPDWRNVRERSVAMLERTRDLRVAVLWLRASVSLDGFGALPQGLRLLHGLLDRFWDTLHPLPDPEDGDPYGRMNALTVLREQENGLLGDLHRASVCNVRGLGDLKGRAVALALGQVGARSDEQVLNKEQVGQMLAAAVAAQPDLREQPAQALAQLAALSTLANERAGADGAPDFKPLNSLLKELAGLMPGAATEADSAEGVPGDADADGGAGSGTGASARAGLSGAIHSRDDAVRAIDMVCEYLERAEPTNPAPLLLRRARRMINRNFLQLMKEFAPDAMAEVARVMGVDPESVQIDGVE